MFRFKSLTAKFIFIGIIILTFIAGYIAAGYIFTHHMKGEAKRINLAGRQRMLMRSIGYESMLVLSLPPSPYKEAHTKGLEGMMAEYEESLYVLRDGSGSLGLKPIPEHNKESIYQLKTLTELWENTQKPTLLSIMKLPPERKNEACGLCHSAIRDNFPKLEALVKSLQDNHEKKLNDFDTFGFYALGFFFVATIFLVLFIRKNIVMPVLRLRDATKEIEKGDFDVMVDIKAEDEIAQLSKSFNLMTQTLGLHIQELDVLNKISTAASRTLALEILLDKVMDEILGLEHLKLAKKGAIFLYDEKKKTLELVVSRNFADEQRKGCGTVHEGECLCGIVAEQKEMLLSESSIEDKRHSKAYSDAKEHGHIILPLKSRDKMLGVLCLYLPPGIKLTGKEIELYKSIADIISVSMQNAINHRQIAMLAQSLESSTNVIVITDNKGMIIHVNPEATQELGYSIDELIGKPVSIIQSPNNPSGLGEEIFRKTLEGRWFGEIINKRKDGSEYPVLLTTSPVKDSDGNIMAHISIARDITERKLMEEKLKNYTEQLEEKVKERTKELENKNYELRSLNEEIRLKKVEAEMAKYQAESANRAKSDFLANMSHELRTPLNSIIGFSEVMRDGIAGTVTDDQKEYLKDIWESGNHLLRLINDILDLSKVEAGKMELEPSEFDVKGLIDGCLMLFKEKAMRHNIKLKAEVEEGIGNIIADERKIKQVILNLLGNAFKFTPDGGSVSVKARSIESESVIARRVSDEAISKNKIATPSARNDNIKDFIEVSVEDTGIGIAPEDMEKLFQPFQQLESVLTKQYEGTGLGLKLCKDFVELHRGKIWAESEKGKGSKFRFAIPVVQNKKLRG